MSGSWWRLACAAALTIRLSGATFHVAEADIAKPARIIVYGDTRFTDPHNVKDTNPNVRRWLVEKIAEEQPAAVLISGDLPLNGGAANDYAVFHAETQIWRDKKLRVYPALGNHEFHGNEKQCLENWWGAFPALNGVRWYSVQFGDQFYFINLDSNSPLADNSPQQQWLVNELESIPATTRFVFVNLHHPPVSDYQPDGDASHNARPNEIAITALIENAKAKARARFIVAAGHVHNYERFVERDVIYLVSGGGGAKPRQVTRTKDDLYRQDSFPNYHYIRFDLTGDQLEAQMIREADPEGSAPKWEVRDRFEILAPQRAKPAVLSTAAGGK